MIYTLFSTVNDDSSQWQADLLEYSWGRIRQPGELVRLIASRPDPSPPKHHHARLVETLNWSPHPFTGDEYPPYNLAASLLEWLFSEPVNGTVLLLESNCVFRSAVATETAPGQVLATGWKRTAAR